MTIVNENPESGIIRGLVQDEGVQRALAAVVVATVVCATRRLIFKV